MSAAADPAIRAVFRRPFAEQVAFFRGKLGNLIPTRTWRDVLRSAHDRGFMVAGAQQADLLADLAAAVDAAISRGESLDAFRARFEEIVARRGWTGWTGEGSPAGRAWRTRVIYRTNLATSYAAGRYAQLQDFPVWVYRHGGSREPRPEHLAWDRLVLPKDHPFWATHYPPSAWGCSCYVVGAGSPALARRLGGDPDKTLPEGWNERQADGTLPGVDEGWDYAPGATVAETVRAVAAKLDTWPPQIAEAFLRSQPEHIRKEFRRVKEAETDQPLIPSPPKPPEAPAAPASPAIRPAPQPPSAPGAVPKPPAIRADPRRVEPAYPPLPKDAAKADRAFVEWVERTLPYGVPLSSNYTYGPLSEPQTRALRAYTGEAFRKLNKALREGRGAKPRAWAPYVDVLDLALSRLPALPGTVYRKITVEPRQWGQVWTKLREGDYVQFVSYTSTSRKTGLLSFSKPRKVRMTIDQVSGRDVRPISVYPSEDETLIPRGRFFRVEEARLTPEGGLDMRLTEVNPQDIRGKVVKLSVER